MSSLRSRFLLPLALLASLLLACVPTLGRLHQSSNATAPHEVALCTVEGLKTVAAPLLAAFASQGEQGAPAPHQKKHDCDYCPLLASLLVFAAIVLLWLGITSHAALPRFASRDIPHCHPCGLGSRGPPLTA